MFSNKALLTTGGTGSFGNTVLYAFEHGTSGDILDPKESFDSHSPICIVKAVKRMMKLESKVDFLILTLDFIDFLDVKERALGSE